MHRVGESGMRYSVSTERFELGGTRFAIVKSFTAWVPAEEIDAPHNAMLTATCRDEREGWRIDSYAAERDEWDDEAPGVTTESLREMPVAWTLRQALAAIPDVAVNSNGEHFRRVFEREIEENRRARGEGPTSSNLARLAEIYRVSRLTGQLTTALIANAFGMPDRTVSHWIKLARERGALESLPEREGR